MSNPICRFLKFSLRQLLAIILAGIMIGFLIPSHAAAAILLSTDQTARAAGNYVWLRLTATL